VKFYKSLFLFSLLLSLTTFVVGCGGDSTVTSDSDPVMTEDPKNDPTINESDPETTAESTEGKKSSETDKSGESDKKK